MEREEQKGVSGTIMGAISGALTMYFLDPNHGRRRRAMFRDQLIHLGHQVRRDAGIIVVDIFNRVKGLTAETRSMFSRPEAPDEVICERVRSALGRAVSHPHAVHVDVNNGRVTLTGYIMENEVPAMMAMISKVRGVKEIEDKLERGQHPEEIPSLQGGRPRRAWKPDLLQSNQAPATRFLLGLGGAVLVRNGLRRGGFLGTASTFGGTLMLTRAVTNLDITRLFGISEQTVSQVNKTLEIDAPVEEVFSFWQNLENFPLFMEGLEDIEIIDDLRSRWTARGPAGIPVTWEARITSLEPNRRISWTSEAGSAVSNSGHVYFQPIDNKTRIHVHIAYCPPLGGLGHAVSTLFLADPKHRLDTDLIRLKSLIEDGKTTAKGREVTRQDIEQIKTKVPVQKRVAISVK